jgi:hypothetical protein
MLMLITKSWLQFAAVDRMSVILLLLLVLVMLIPGGWLSVIYPESSRTLRLSLLLVHHPSSYTPLL